MAARRRLDIARERIKRPPSLVRERVRSLRARFVFQREMRLRLMSAAVLIPSVLVLTYVHEISFALVVLLTGALVLYEWLRMIGAGGSRRLCAVGWVGLAVIATATLTQPIGVALAVMAMAVLASIVAAWAVKAPARLRWVAAGTLYAGAAILALVALRKGADGFGAVVFVFLVAWATDTAAFFVGRRVGGPRLWRRVSPSKTWSGAFGGLVAGVVFGAAVALWLDVPLGPAVLLAAALVAVSAQAGDLLESAAKRRFSIKDAGTLIPGHGGVMDRVDGLIAASLVTMALGWTVAGATPAAGLLALMGR